MLWKETVIQMTKQFGERAGEEKLRGYFEGYTTIEYQKDMSRKYHGGLIGTVAILILARFHILYTQLEGYLTIHISLCRESTLMEGGQRAIKLVSGSRIE